MEMKTLEDLLADQLKDLYSAENQLVKALPKMAKNADNEELRSGFEEHLEQTRGQVKRLEQIAKIMDIPLRGKKCAAMEGLIEEGKELMEEDAEPAVLDAGLIAAAQKVEHYEIASYGSCHTWAEQMGLSDVAELLQETLDEEKETDQKLTELALSGINQESAHGAGDDEGDMRSNGKRPRKALARSRK